ncbi:MAG TPA: sugar phosphate isomerase/epimerase [Edaphobacter sp.]|nr:sugar phosphate isomerase/epimerase [Edaphobacter sp.]
MYSRRKFGKLAAMAIPMATTLQSRADAMFHGVRLGAITYSFHDMPNAVGQDHVDAVIADCKACGLELIELLSSHVEPYAAPARPASATGTAGPQGGAVAPGGAPIVGQRRSPEAMKNREVLREWRLNTPMSHFVDIRKRLAANNISVYAYTVNSFGNDFTDEEMDRVFDQAKAIGATCISSSTTLTAAQKTAPFAEKHNFPVTFHNHQDITDPNQFATPESFYKAMAMSKMFRINLDIGYITGSGSDAVDFIKKNHDRITHIHVKDRKRNLGPSVPWGEGDTPITPVLKLLGENHYPIPALVELSYTVPDSSNCVTEVKKCLKYMKQVLS